MIIVDTREQKTLDFREEVIHQKLDVGDYGYELDGHILPLVFERKSGIDLFGTLTHDHERFKAELERARDNDIRLIVIIENTYNSIKNKRFAGANYTKMKGSVIISIIHTIQLKYGIQFVFCSNRPEVASYIKDCFNSYLKVVKKA